MILNRDFWLLLSVIIEGMPVVDDAESAAIYLECEFNMQRLFSNIWYREIACT